MTLRGFLLCYLGSVLLVGTAGASGYHLLARHRAQVAARETPEPSSAISVTPAIAAVQPLTPNGDLVQAPHPAASNGPPNPAASSPHRRTAALPLSLPPLRPHIAAAGAGYSRAWPAERRVAQQSTSRVPAARAPRHPAGTCNRDAAAGAVPTPKSICAELASLWRLCPTSAAAIDPIQRLSRVSGVSARLCVPITSDTRTTQFTDTRLRFVDLVTWAG